MTKYQNPIPTEGIWGRKEYLEEIGENRDDVLHLGIRSAG